MQHHLRHAAGQEHAHGGMVAGPVGQHVHQPRHLPVDVDPVLHHRASQPRRVRDRGQVEQQIRRAADRRVHHHGVPHRGVGDDVARGQAARRERRQRAGRAPGHVEPDRLPGGRERGVRQRQAERLADDLGRGRGPEKLAAAARRAARAAAQVGRPLQRELTVREPGPDGLHGPRVLALGGRQRHAARHQHAGQIAQRGQRHHHRGQALVARGDAEHAPPRGERPGQPPQHHRRVVAVGQAVHHARRALGAPVARVRAEAGERQAAERGQLLGGRLHEQPDLPVSRVVPERDRLAVGGADAALGGEHEELWSAKLARIPAHARVLGEPEDVAARALEQHLRGQRQPTLRARPRSLDLPDRRVGPNDLVEPGLGNFRRHRSPHFGPHDSLFWLTLPRPDPGVYSNSITCATGRLASELLPSRTMLKRLGRRLLELIDSVPLGWLVPERRPIPVRIRRRYPLR